MFFSRVIRLESQSGSSSSCRKMGPVYVFLFSFFFSSALASPFFDNRIHSLNFIAQDFSSHSSLPPSSSSSESRTPLTPSSPSLKQVINFQLTSLSSSSTSSPVGNQGVEAVNATSSPVENSSTSSSNPLTETPNETETNGTAVISEEDDGQDSQEARLGMTFYHRFEKHGKVLWLKTSSKCEMFHP